MNKKAVYIFRRDLRLNDNTALNLALENSEQVIPVFIFNPKQIDNNPYKSDASISFMLQSLAEIDHELRAKQSKLHVFYTDPAEAIKELAKLDIEAIYLNSDYTPFSIERDLEMQNVCEKLKISFNPSHDLLLTIPGEVLKSDKNPYVVYTPFFNAASKIEVRTPKSLKKNNFGLEESLENLEDIEINFKKIEHQPGGRKEALKILAKLGNLTDYSDLRNFPAQTGTSRLSPHLKFGTISIREVYHLIKKSLGANSQLIKELYWRDFFTHISFHFPRIFKGCFYEKYNQIEWNENTDWFQKWCSGQTGFPIVDAGMRELNSTGYMHNRVRMIVASFLVKDLHLPWQWGEKYFANQLVDYDPSINNGNWQWGASVGCDAAPYFRVFNPWLQQEKFDKQCIYIKKWVPELNDLNKKQIHDPEFVRPNYPKPMVEHSVQKTKAILLYSELAD